MSMSKEQKKVITEIYVNHRQDVYYHVLSMIKNKQNAEDITNDVFYKMINLDSVKFDINNAKKASITTWLRTITYHVTLDYIRKNKKHNKLNYISDNVEFSTNDSTVFVASKTTNADAKVLTSETQENIVSAFHNLSPKYRRIATLFFIREYKYNEIAIMLNVPEGTVKGMIFRCRAKLQESLKTTQMAY